MASMHVYTKLNEILKSELKVFNVYGIIVDSNYRISYDRLGRAQDEFRIKINDGDEDVNVTAYYPIDHILSTTFQRGKIARFHRLQKNTLKNTGGFYLCGRIGTPTSILLYDIPLPGATFLYNPSFQSNTHYSKSQKDVEILKVLISKSKSILEKNAAVSAESNNNISPVESLTSQNSPILTMSNSSHLKSQTAVSNATFSQTPTENSVSSENKQQTSQASASSRNSSQQSSKDDSKHGGLFKDICEIVSGKAYYYNLLLQIVSCYTNSRGNVVLRVWDGTRNLKKTYIAQPNDLKLVYGDVKREKIIAAQNKLYDVICYDNHGRDAANLNPGDYIALINVHFFIPNNCWLPCLVMHSGGGRIKSATSIVGAGRKIARVTREVSVTCYEYIDEKIKEHEPSLKLPMEENEIEKPVHSQQSQTNTLSTQEEELDDGWNDPIDIPMIPTIKSTSTKSTGVSVTVAVQTTQISTINSNINDSRESFKTPSQFPPKQNSETATIHSTSNSNISKAVSSQITESTEVTVSKHQKSPAIRRPAAVAFSNYKKNLDSSCPPKCARIQELSNYEGSQGSTQALFDRLKSRDSQTYDLDVFMTEEQKFLN